MNKQETIKAWIKRHPLWAIFIPLIIALILSNEFFGHYPFYYSTGPITGTVIDKKTGEPIEGAVVVLQFTLEGSAGNFHGTRRQAIYLDESVTDAKGGYHFSEWRAEHEYRMKAQSHTPSVFAYRRGYKPNGVFNDGRNNEREFEFSANNVFIELEAYESPQEEINDIMNSLHSWRTGNGMKCSFSKIPNFKIENSERIRRLLPYTDGKNKSINGISADLAKVIDGMVRRGDWKKHDCDDPRIVFKKYLENH